MDLHRFHAAAGRLPGRLVRAHRRGGAAPSNVLDSVHQAACGRARTCAWHLCRIHFGLTTYNDSNDALNTLGVDAYNFNRPKPAVIATSCVYLFVVVLLVLLSLARSFIEAAHDATGESSASTVLRNRGAAAVTCQGNHSCRWGHEQCGPWMASRGAAKADGTSAGVAQQQVLTAASCLHDRRPRRPGRARQRSVDGVQRAGLNLLVDHHAVADGAHRRLGHLGRRGLRAARQHQHPAQ